MVLWTTFSPPLLLLAAFLLLSVATTTAFTAFQSFPQQRQRQQLTTRHPLFESTPRNTASSQEVASLQQQPLFDFSNPSRNDTAKFERIDDVIMGGISSSTLLQNQDEPFARWRGVCRVDGGGFCGVRTLPFREKLQVDFAEGLYVKCRLSSDKDTDKRVWKITTRTEESRGEQLYQAMFDIPPPLLDDDDDDDDNVEWATVQIPFSNFTLVRGARKVKDGKPFDAENGIFQIGFTMSKFKIGENMTELEGFRPGFFELQFKEIGLYSRSPVELVGGDLPNTVNALSKAEALQKRPLMLKILSPIFKIVFLTEKQKRRQAAVKQLTEKRGMSRWRATRLGVKWRVKQQGLFKATFNLTRIVVGDALRLLLRSILRYGVFFPLRFFNQAIATVKKILKMSSVKVEQQEKS